MTEIDPNLYASLAKAYLGGLTLPTPAQVGYYARVNATGTNLEYVQYYLPPVDEVTDGYVLTAASGVATWAAPAVSLPDWSGAADGDWLQVVDGEPAWGHVQPFGTDVEQRNYEDNADIAIISVAGDGTLTIGDQTLLRAGAGRHRLESPTGWEIYVLGSLSFRVTATENVCAGNCVPLGITQTLGDSDTPWYLSYIERVAPTEVSVTSDGSGDDVLTLRDSSHPAGTYRVALTAKVTAAATTGTAVCVLASDTQTLTVWAPQTISTTGSLYLPEVSIYSGGSSAITATWSFAGVTGSPSISLRGSCL